MPFPRARNAAVPSPDACRERALRLLEQRPHAVAELRRKLVQRGFTPGTVDPILADLQRLGLLNDEAVARDACAAALRGTAALGRNRILMHLRRHGIDSDVAESAIREASAEAGTPGELERAVIAGRAKLRLLAREADPRKRRDKLARFLIGRGFAPATVWQAVDRLTASAASDEPSTDSE